MLFGWEAAFDSIRHLIYEPKETWTPRVHKDLKYLSIFFFSVGLGNYALKLLDKGETLEVTSKTQTSRITQHTWSNPVKQTHGSGLVTVSPVYPFLHLVMFPLISLKPTEWISEEPSSSAVGLAVITVQGFRLSPGSREHTVIGVTHFWHHVADSAIMDSSV